MMTSHELKKQLRHDISSLKKSYGKSALLEHSVAVMQRLEECEAFKQSTCIALYHSLPDEVNTVDFIEKWGKSKTILLPVVEGEDLRLFPYRGPESLQIGAYGIMEPKEVADFAAHLDLIVVPGVAFDRNGNRLGRGKGYYDRLLSHSQVKTVGICFDFQLVEAIPTEPFDRKMDMIISESESIGI